MLESFVGRQIRRDALDVALRRQRLNRFGDLGLLAGRDDDVGPCVEQAISDHVADATATTGDDGTLALKSEQ